MTDPERWAELCAPGRYLTWTDAEREEVRAIGRRKVAADIERARQVDMRAPNPDLVLREWVRAGGLRARGEERERLADEIDRRILEGG